MRSFAFMIAAFVASVVGLNCNGRAELCDRKYSNVTWIGAHNSPFVGVLPTQNQLDDVATQLRQGVRFLTAQTHNKDGAIQLCHSECELLDVGPLQNFLGTVKTFLDGNKNELVTLLITNQDSIDVKKFADAFKAVGLDAYAYAPKDNLALADWPTLGELIASNKRVVVFMDYHNDLSKAPYILDEFKYWFETPFDPTDRTFSSCNLDRPGGASPNGRMYLVNHNLNIKLFGDILIPATAEAVVTNSMNSILSHSAICIGKYGRDPNVVLLDYIGVGDAIRAQNNLNGF